MNHEQKSGLNDPKTKSSSYLNNTNWNANYDTYEDAEEMPSPLKRGFNKVYGVQNVSKS
jgi:hypothetical protein